MKLVYLLLLLFPIIAFGQTQTFSTKTEKLKPYEVKLLKELDLLVPKTVKRYYKISNGYTENYFNECVYVAKNNLIAEMYVYYNVSFSGDTTALTLNYENSVGKAYITRGTFIIENGDKIQTDYSYGTSNGEIRVTKNGKVVFKNEMEFKN